MISRFQIGIANGARRSQRLIAVRDPTGPTDLGRGAARAAFPPSCPARRSTPAKPVLSPRRPRDDAVDAVRRNHDVRLERLRVPRRQPDATFVFARMRDVGAGDELGARVDGERDEQPRRTRRGRIISCRHDVRFDDRRLAVRSFQMQPETTPCVAIRDSSRPRYGNRRSRRALIPPPHGL